MLIPCDRLKAADLRLWAELEAGDLAWGQSPGLARKVTRSLEAVRSFADAGLCYCSVSWGVDSVTMADLVLRAAPEVPLVHVRVTPSGNPHNADVRNAFLRLWPAADYREIVADYGDVYAQGRYSETDRDKATDRVFFGAFRDADRAIAARSFRGIRADESGRRRMSLRHRGLATAHACRPIGWWAKADAFAYCAFAGLPVHPNYAMLGGGRWPRDQLRVAEIGDVHGTERGRREHEREYYGDVLNRLASTTLT